MAADPPPAIPPQSSAMAPVVQDTALERKVRMAEVYLAYLSLAIIVVAFVFAITARESASPPVAASNTASTNSGH